MSRKPKPSPAAGKPAGRNTQVFAAPENHPNRNLRETVESIAIAFILAFLFRTFEAEAFVIPTGSMAPTLQGLHKDVDCVKCGYGFQVNASREEGRPNDADPPQVKQESAIVNSGTCPMCRFNMKLARDGEDGERQPSYPGDRILVGKFAYEFSDPQRWDVVVFKFPGDAKMNYIKRLVGLPDEEVMIRHGDIHTRKLGSPAPFQIARKPASKVLAMAQVVHDNAYVPSEMVRNGWPLRWQVWTQGPAAEPDGWVASPLTPEVLEAQDIRQSFSIAGENAADRWIRYQHFVPSAEQWYKIGQGPLPVDEVVRPQLISDFYAYNTDMDKPDWSQLGVKPPTYDKVGLHWVGDLMLETDVQVNGPGGEVLLDLVEGGNHFTCRIDVATGAASLDIRTRTGEPLASYSPRAETKLRGPGSYQLRFANFDDQLFLWIDGSLVQFDGETGYQLAIERPYTSAADAGDLAPAGVGSRGAALNVTKLRVLRDNYYIAVRWDSRVDSVTDMTTGQLLTSLQDWDAFTKRRAVEFELRRDADDSARDRFLVLGDNGPFSKDSRLWPEPHNNFEQYWVERQQLIGKALCVYWPHSWHRVPGTRIPFPWFPNFSDMGLVR